MSSIQPSVCVTGPTRGRSEAIRLPLPRARALAPFGIYTCGDGLVAANCAEEAMWDRLVELMGNPDWAHEEIFKNRLARGRKLLRARLSGRQEDWGEESGVRERCRGSATGILTLDP